MFSYFSIFHVQVPGSDENPPQLSRLLFVEVATNTGLPTQRVQLNALEVATKYGPAHPTRAAERVQSFDFLPPAGVRVARMPRIRK